MAAGTVCCISPTPGSSSSELVLTIATALAVDPEEARAQVAIRLDDLFAQARLAAEIRDAELLESILVELSLVNDFQRSLEADDLG